MIVERMREEILRARDMLRANINLKNTVMMSKKNRSLIHHVDENQMNHSHGDPHNQMNDSHGPW